MILILVFQMMKCRHNQPHFYPVFHDTDCIKPPMQSLHKKVHISAEICCSYNVFKIIANAVQVYNKVVIKQLRVRQNIFITFS